MFGQLLVVGQKLLGKRQILLGRFAARPGAGDRPHIDPRALLAHQHLGGGADHEGLAETEEEHVR